MKLSETYEDTDQNPELTATLLREVLVKTKALKLLFLLQVSPEIVKLREEAAIIIKQGLTYDEDGDPELNTTQGKPGLSGTKMLATGGGGDQIKPFLNLSHQNSQAQGFHTANRLENLDNSTEGHGLSFLSTFGGGGLQDSLGTSVLNAKLQVSYVIKLFKLFSKPYLWMVRTKIT